MPGLLRASGRWLNPALREALELVESPGEFDPDTASDEALVAGVRAGDERAFEALVRRHHGAMQRIARSMLRRESVAEDAVQDAWIGVLRGVDGFDGRAAFRTWLYRVLINAVRAAARRETRAGVLGDADAVGSGDEPVAGGSGSLRFRGAADRWQGGWIEAPVPWPDPADALEHRQVAALVREAIEQLPESQREVITLRDVHGLEVEEACAVLGISPGNCRVLLHRARTRVRERLDAHFRRTGGGP